MNMLSCFIGWKFVVVESQQPLFNKNVNCLTAYIVASFGRSDFFSKVVYVFVSYNRREIKIVFWDGTGFSLWRKKVKTSKQTNFKLVNLPILFADFSMTLNGFNC